MRFGAVRRRGSLLAAVACCGLVLAGCESGRFGGRRPVVAARVAPPETLAEPTVTAVPSSSVTSEPLAPISGTAIASVPAMPGSPGPIETLGGQPQAAPPAGTSRLIAIGAWTAREATGTSCRVNLTSTPSLDLYRAAASGCANKDLARVTAWDFRDGEVYLYQPGGAVAARLRSSGGSLAGVLSKSGAPLTLTRG